MKVRGWKIVIYANGNQKKAGISIHMFKIIDFKILTIMRNKEHCIKIKGSVQEEDIRIVIIYAYNIGEPQYRGKY